VIWAQEDLAVLASFAPRGFREILVLLPGGIYTNDTGFFERMYDLWIIDTLPEEVAHQARPLFPKG
jgi:hypothetical protein